MPALTLPKPGAYIVPPAYAAAATAKAGRDKASYEAFRKIDQDHHVAAHKERTAAAVSKWEEEVRLFNEDVSILAEEAAQALAGSRAAEDRERSSRTYAREQVRAYERLKDTGDPKEITEAMTRMQNAEQVAASAAIAAVSASQASVSADQEVATAKQGLGDAERELASARRDASLSGGTAPFSIHTIRACAQYIMFRNEIWDSLREKDRNSVRQALQPPQLDLAEVFALREAL